MKINQMRHRHICQPVAAQLRRAMLLACLAQVLKLAIWGTMIALVWQLAGQHTGTAAWLVPGLLVLSVLYYTLKIRAHDESHYAAYRLEEILRARVAAKIARLPVGVARQWGAGGLTKVLLDDVQSLHAYVADAPPLKAEAYVTPLLVFALLLWLDWRLALAVGLFTSALFVLLALLFRRGQHFRQQYAQALAAVNRAIIEYVQGMATVRSFDAGSASFGRYRQTLADFNTVMQGWLKQSGWVTRLARVLFTPMPVMIFLLLLTLAYRPESPVWFAFMLLAAGVVETMHPYMGLYHLLEKSRVAIERIADLEGLPELVQTARPQTPANHAICYEEVAFAYGGQANPALHGISLTIPERSFTAVVGASGSGKTTLISLLPRFWDVTAGRITLGGVDIRNMDQTDLLSRCSVVMQDNFLFSCSIADNIRYGLSNISDDEVVAAAKKAHIHDFIATLPEGYQTRAGERGQLLSGGQKQRITIARAFLQNRPILILDEPTAFADARNEALLLKAFRALMQDRTVIMIAHRLGNIVAADQIVCLDKGRISACGRHDALLANSEHYRQLWQDYHQTRAWTLQTTPSHQPPP